MRPFRVFGPSASRHLLRLNEAQTDMATKLSDTMVDVPTRKKRIRKIFGDIHEVIQMPNLIEVQRESYEQFLRSDPSIDYVSGLEKTLRSVFPIRDFAGTAEMDFVHYELEDPKYDVEECRQRGITYAAPMRVTLRLIVFEVDQDTETRSVLDIKEQDVYMGDMPLMTGNGTFIVNGTERVIVSQMHRSPGVLFDHDRGKTHSSGKYLFAARVIPYRGSWLDFEFDAKDIVNVRIDRKRKLPVTALLYALGLTAEDILGQFYNNQGRKNQDQGFALHIFEKDMEPVFFRPIKLLHTFIKIIVVIANRLGCHHQLPPTQPDSPG